MLKLIKYSLLVASFLIGGLAAQTRFSVPRDTSFTVRNAFEKERKRYPFIKIVQDSLPENIAEKRDVVYRSIGDRELHLDMFFPAKSEKSLHPAILLVHGGGWRSGDKSHLVPMAQQLAACGFVAATVEYRLSPEAKYPAAVHDLKAAIRWLRANAKDQNIDPEKIVILGCSSGAQLATLVGFTNGIVIFDGNGENREFSAAVQAVVNIDGIVDFTSEYVRQFEDDPRKNPSAAGAWFGGRYHEKTGLWTEASPLQYVSASSPPILFVNSAISRFHAGRDEMIAQLDLLGIYSEVHTLPDTPHPFWLFHPWFSQTVEIISAFLDKPIKNK